jgi:monoamine oxidase
MVQIEGGMDNLPRAFLPQLRSRIRFGAEMVALEQSPEGVTVVYETAGGRFKVSGDSAIITVPFPVLRHVEILQPFSRAKQRAIRQLHYDASAKIWFQCRRRFWETDDGIFGGGTATDLPIRVVYYPDHGRESGRGVLLASYTWSEDAQRWGSLSPDERIEQALEDLEEIHPQVREEFEVGASKMWHDDEYAGGAFALFDPSSRPCSTATSSPPRAACTSPASTPRSTTPGSKAPSNPACAKRRRSMRRVWRVRVTRPQGPLRPLERYPVARMAVLSTGVGAHLRVRPFLPVSAAAHRNLLRQCK